MAANVLSCWKKRGHYEGLLWFLIIGAIAGWLADNS